MKSKKETSDTLNIFIHDTRIPTLIYNDDTNEREDEVWFRYFGFGKVGR